MSLHSSRDLSPLVPHFLTLAEQACDQVAHLQIAMDAHLFLARFREPDSEDGFKTEDFLSSEQLLAVQRALDTEMHRQVKALVHTSDALTLCATQLASERR